MTLRAGMKSPRDMLAKLRAEHARLLERVTSGDLMNFAITGYHLIDWIRKDPSALQSAKDDLEAMYRNTDIGVCRDITNESKHFELKEGYRDRVTEKTSTISDYGSGRFGAGPYGLGKSSASHFS
jgi:hypothetical protein